MKNSARLNFLRRQLRHSEEVQRLGITDERVTKEIDLLKSQIIRQKEIDLSIKNGMFNVCA